MRVQDDGGVRGDTRNEAEADPSGERQVSTVRYVPVITYEVKARSSWQELTGLPVNEPSVTNPQLDYHSGDER